MVNASEISINIFIINFQTGLNFLCAKLWISPIRKNMPSSSLNSFMVLSVKPYWWIHFWLHFININQNIVLRTISIITAFSRLGFSVSPDFKYILRSHKILLYATLGDSWEIPEKQLNAFFSSTHRCIKAQIFQTDQSLVWKIVCLDC